jgi:hypothetical protein
MFIPRHRDFHRTRLSFLFGLCCVLTIPLTAAEMTAEEQAVWRLEEQYWVYVKNSNIDAYRTLWDDRFVGWPSFSQTPVEKDAIGGWIRPLHADPEQKFDYALERMAVRSFGEVVVAHCRFSKRMDPGGPTFSKPFPL